MDSNDCAYQFYAVFSPKRNDFAFNMLLQECVFTFRDDQPIWIAYTIFTAIAYRVWQQNKFELSFFIFAHRGTTTLNAIVWVVHNANASCACEMLCVCMCVRSREIGICVTLLFFIPILLIFLSVFFFCCLLLTSSG